MKKYSMEEIVEALKSLEENPFALDTPNTLQADWTQFCIDMEDLIGKVKGDTVSYQMNDMFDRVETMKDEIDYAKKKIKTLVYDLEGSLDDLRSFGD